MESEASSQEVPQLAVETENVRKNSASIADTLTCQQSNEHEAESLAYNVLLPKTQEGSQTEGGTMKRIDSDSKFGKMETIPLELNTQEKSTPEGSEGNNLSKYFSSMDKVATDAEGIDFFNALSESTSCEAITNLESVKQIDAANIDNELEKKTVDPILHSEPSPENKKREKTPPALLKFFAEDKSGSDRDGKAFFDKIAEEKSIRNEARSLGLAKFSQESPTSRDFEEAWIPCDKTRQTLITVATCSPGSFVPDKNMLTLPEIIIVDEMEDPVKALMAEFHLPHAAQRKSLTMNDVDQDEEGLKKLIENECYHAAINLTKHLLTTASQGPSDTGFLSQHTPFSLRLWYTRLALLVKLKKFSLAEVESAAFGELDKPDLYYEFYPDTYKGKRGTMVPFCFRLLLAELPQYQGNHQIALDNLYAILNVIQKILSNLQNNRAEDGSMFELSNARRKASLELWGEREKRVLQSILNCVVSQKDYVLAVSIVKIMMEKDNENAPQLHSTMGRIYLQLGDVKCAQDCFAKAAALANEKSENEKMQVEEKINKALLAVAHNNSEEAYKYYQQACALCPENKMLANNMAVCLLYMGQLKESLELLERTTRDPKAKSLHDGIVFNTCTLYELEFSRSTQKKLGMLDLVSKQLGDGFNLSCLKLPPNPKA